MEKNTTNSRVEYLSSVPRPPPPIHTWQVTEVMLELKSFWLRIPSSCKVGWVFLWAYCVCKQKAAVLLGHRAMLEAPSALSIKTENAGKQTWLSRGLGWCLLFLNKTIEKFSTQKSKNINVQDCAAGSETHSGLFSCRCAVWTEVKFPGGWGWYDAREAGHDKVMHF